MKEICVIHSTKQNEFWVLVDDIEIVSPIKYTSMRSSARGIMISELNASRVAKSLAFNEASNYPEGCKVIYKEI